MHVTTFASFKGGSGKSTTAIAMASAIIDDGRGSVFLLDLDQRQTSIADIYATLKEASRHFDYCIIDTQGAQTPLAAAAIRVSDLILIPFQISGIEIEPFVITHSLAKKCIEVDGARLLGITTRMPNIASTTMTRTREVLQKYGIDVANGTSQRDGYQQLVFESGTFAMIANKYADAAKAADNPKARRRAENEERKAAMAAADMQGVMDRIGFVQESAAAPLEEATA